MQRTFAGSKWLAVIASTAASRILSPLPWHRTTVPNKERIFIQSDMQDVRAHTTTKKCRIHLRGFSIRSAISLDSQELVSRVYLWSQKHDTTRRQFFRSSLTASGL